jgi:serpin B
MLREPLTRVRAVLSDVDAAGHRRWRRRRLIWLAGAVAVAIVAAVLVPTLTGSSDGPPLTVPPSLRAAGVVVGDHLKDGVELVADVQPLAADDAEAARAVATAEQALSLALLQQVQKDAGAGTDVSVSPASLAAALAMLQNGAAGATLKEIRKTLHSSGLSTDEQNTGMASLAAEWHQAAEDDHITLDTANALFLQRGFPLWPAFLATLKSSYDAGVWQVDYAQRLSEAIDTINAWTSEQTHGKITKLFEDGQLDPTTVAVLANAVYFHAAWSHPFDPSDSSPATFYGPSGQSTPRFMAQTSSSLAWTTGDGVQAVELPYAGGRFAALAVMPTTGSLAQFVDGLTPDRLDAIVASLHDGDPAMVTMPTFTTTSTLDLGGTLAALGMPTAFTARADLSALSPQPTQIQAVEQRVYLAVAEKGTEAAAVTGVAADTASGSSGGTILSFDHPFLFLIRDTATGAILFASLVQNPAS